jgi:hypothetical protein
MRIALFSFVSCIAAQIAASDLPAGSTWAADARSGAMARPYWTDSANWNLFNAAGHSSVLPGAKGAPLQLRLGTSGIGADNSYATMSQSEVAAFQLRGVIENKAGYILDLGWIDQSAGSEGGSTYDAGRFAWGFDVGTAFGPDRLVGFGIGARMMFPSSQTQDTALGVSGDFERWQPTIQSLRAGLSSHFAQSVTLAAKFEASAVVDTLLHSGAQDGLQSLHRFALVRLPIISLSAQFDKADLPVQGLLDVTFGSTYRMGAMKTLGNAANNPAYANVDFPTLVGDSLRVLVGTMGRWTVDGHTFRPVIVFERGSLKTQMYAPIAGSKDPFAKGEKLSDSGWTQESEGGTLGTSYSWDRGVAANVEFSSVKRNIEFLSGIERENESHTDLGMALGVEASHRLVPVWNEKVPTSMEFFLRMGWERRSLAGFEVQTGFLDGLNMGYEEPPTGYVGSVKDPTGAVVYDRGWNGQEEYVGMAPSLGYGFDLNLFTFGLGATFLEKALALNTAFQVGSIEPNEGDAFDVFGWRAEVSWSH